MADEKTPETKTSADDVPRPLTTADLDTVINQKVQAIITARDERAARKAAKDAAAKAEADAALEATEGGEGEPVKRASTGDATADAIADLKAQNERLDMKLKRQDAERRAEAKAREAERENALRNEESLKVTEILKGVNIPEARIKGVLALFSVDKRIARDPSGAIVYRVDEDESVPLAEGIKRWLDSDDGKQYLPARGAAGAGFQRGNVRSSGATPADRKAAAQAAARNALPGLVRKLAGG